MKMKMVPTTEKQEAILSVVSSAASCDLVRVMAKGLLPLNSPRGRGINR